MSFFAAYCLTKYTRFGPKIWISHTLIIYWTKFYHFLYQIMELPIITQMGLRTQVHLTGGTKALDFVRLASPFWLLSIAALWHFLFDKMILFLNNNWNFPSKTKIAPNSTNINKIEILTVLQDSFIHGTQDDMVNDTNNKELTAQNSNLDHNALNDTLESRRSTVFSPSSSSPFIWSRMGNVEPFELVITRSSFPSCMNLSWLACNGCMFTFSLQSPWTSLFLIDDVLFTSFVCSLSWLTRTVLSSDVCMLLAGMENVLPLSARVEDCQKQFGGGGLGKNRLAGGGPWKSQGAPDEVPPLWGGRGLPCEGRWRLAQFRTETEQGKPWVWPDLLHWKELNLFHLVKVKSYNIQFIDYC